MPEGFLTTTNPPDDSDEILVGRLLDNDANALRALMLRYYSRLVVFASAYVDSQDAAEDAVQSVFITLWERRAQTPSAQELGPYLFGAVRNRAISAYRASATRQRYHVASTEESMGQGQGGAFGTEQQLELDDLTARLNQEIASLPPRCREIFRMSRDQGMSYAEIAAALGISPYTVRAQIAKALDTLRRDLRGWISSPEK